MCGIHDHNGSPIGHQHHGSDGAGSDQLAGHSNRPIFRPRTATERALSPTPRSRRTLTPTPRSRRAFLGEFGKGTMALAVFTPLVAACSSSDSSTAADDPAGSDSSSTAAGTQDETEATAASTTEGTESTDNVGGAEAQGDGSDEGQLRWARANLGFVSAYVLARGSSAAIVDTGTPGSAEAIGETLGSLGLSYSDVEHLILTHHHNDHAGSIGEVMAEATSATVYAGEADLDQISANPITGLVGDEEVFGLRMVATPGHTAGHMAVFDETTGLLVAGDAIFTEDGGVTEGPPRFFSDIPESRESIRDLAALSFNTLLVGHGDPIESDADTAVADLAASLP